MNSLRLTLEWWLLLAASMGCLWLIHSSETTQRLDNQLFDFGTALSRPGIRGDIAIVTIDDRSIAELGAWPWPRAIHGEIIDRLTEAGARATVLDVLILDEGDPEDLAVLVGAAERSGRVFLPHSFTAQPDSANGSMALMPVPDLVRTARGVGHVVAEPDGDGVLRRFGMEYSLGGVSYPHLAKILVSDLGPSEMALPEQPIVPILPLGSFTQLPAAELLAAETAPEFLKDAIVIVGATAQGMGDRYSVAAGSVGLMSGVETQANLINTLLSQSWIETVPASIALAIGAFAILVLFTGFRTLSPRASFLLTLGLAAALVMLSLGMLLAARLWFAPASALVVLLFAYPLWSWRRLSYVSSYLEQEAARLFDEDAPARSNRGIDVLSRQTARLRSLVRLVTRSRDFVRQVIEASPDAIFVLDADSVVVMANSRASDLLSSVSVLERPIFSELLIMEKVRRDPDTDELETADGRTFLIARAPFSPPETGGMPDLASAPQHGEILALRDITERRLIENERQQMLEFLSHDMRTPQAAIIALTRKASLAGETRDIVRRIRTQAERTLKLADDFVQLARLDYASISPEDTDLGALIEEACDRAFSQAEAARIALVQHLPEEPCFVCVDGSLIARMMDNLIGNAIKYCAAGDRIEISLDCGTGGQACLTISDSGPGFPPERQADPFARFGAHAVHAGPSAGLGLTLVKKAVEVHEGTIAVRSLTGEGTTFTITLPR